MLTDLQQRKLMLAFNQWDNNGDGHLAADDYARIADRIAESRGWAADSPESQQVHETYAQGWQFMQQFADTDHNHEVSPVEWMACFDQILNSPDLFQQIIVGTADLNFGAADLDGDGRWTLDEYRVYLRTLNAPDDRAEEVFRKADVNGDGHISKEMFTHLLSQFFLSDDPNSVGNWLLGPH